MRMHFQFTMLFAILMLLYASLTYCQNNGIFSQKKNSYFYFKHTFYHLDTSTTPMPTLEQPYQKIIIVIDSWFTGTVAFLIILIVIVSLLIMKEFFKRRDRDFLLNDDDNLFYTSSLYDSD